MNFKQSFHVAIIPDANRRWAKKNNLKPWEGHVAGANNLENILKVAQKLKITHLTFWGSSQDNLLKRPYLEKLKLLEIYQKYFLKILNSKEVHQNEIKVNVLGNWKNYFSLKLCDIINKVVLKTQKYNKFSLNFLLAYSGEEEMVQAVLKIAQDFKAEKLKLIDKTIIKKYLYTKDLPKVDLLIRTGSFKDPHLSSGFMMWDIQDAQLYFTQLAWPEFSEKEFIKIINQYKKTERRYGA